jgi:GNAT superfamily N-acetyltransferase
LAVHPDQRSTGIGAALLTTARQWAADHGATHLELDSATTRVDAHRFYDRHQPTTRSITFSWQLT